MNNNYLEQVDENIVFMKEISLLSAASLESLKDAEITYLKDLLKIVNPDCEFD